MKPIGVSQHVKAHQTNDNEHNHGGHDPHDTHFFFLSVFFTLLDRMFVSAVSCARKTFRDILTARDYSSLTEETLNTSFCFAKLARVPFPEQRFPQRKFLKGRRPPAPKY